MEANIIKEAEESFMSTINDHLGERALRLRKEDEAIAEARRNLDKQDINEQLMSQAIVKRKEWAKKYKLDDKIVFDLFSEFSGMMMAAKA